MERKNNRLHRFLSNRNISTVARRLLVAVVRPTLEYGSEVWACNKGRQLPWNLFS